MCLSTAASLPSTFHREHFTIGEKDELEAIVEKTILISFTPIVLTIFQQFFLLKKDIAIIRINENRTCE